MVVREQNLVVVDVGCMLEYVQAAAKVGGKVAPIVVVLQGPNRQAGLHCMAASSGQSQDSSLFVCGMRIEPIKPQEKE